MIKKYDEMIKESEDQIKEINIEANQDLKFIKENLILLHSVNSGDCRTEDRDVENKLLIVNRIVENVNNLLTGTRAYDYHEYTANIDTQITSKQILVNIKDGIARFQGQI